MKYCTNILQYIKGNTRYFLMVVMLTTILPSCKKFVTVENPPGILTTEKVFADDRSATSAIVSIYIDMMNYQFGGDGSFVCFSMTALAGFSGNELQWTQNNTNAPAFQEFTTHDLTPPNRNVAAFWKDGYNYIYRANAILEGIAASAGMTADGKKLVEGEAKFIRGFCYFYLVNLFGDVPLVLITDYRANMKMARTPSATVWEQILNDLKDAKQLLPANYPTPERLRPNRATVGALLARAYLYLGRWAEAEAESDAIIASSVYGAALPAPDLVFKKESTETIWQLQPVRAGINTNEAFFFLTTVDTRPSYEITQNLLSAFEPNDKRKTQWIGFSSPVANPTWAFPAKYKDGTSATVTEYYIVFRLTEQYLIRAEARAHQGGSKLAQAITDLNTVRSRAGLPVANPADQNAFYLAMEKERQVEFFAEWGHRWLDLKRTNRAEAVLKPLSVTNSWKPGSELYPVPADEIAKNPLLIQNPGY
ncbi:MAG TPA: RagB/SusD family nutrient uptake outer membrane protein [Chitinophagaceae bacterium]|nr:RagB/SusD family nutrient uptake outer membrane protein [Chitinophagaceae bacterium]